MSKGLIGVLGLVLGLVLGWIGSVGLIGASAGIGIATGLSAGICGVARAAQDEGLLTEEQVDQVFNRARANLAELTGEDGGETIVGGATECDAVLERLRSAGES